MPEKYSQEIRQFTASVPGYDAPLKFVGAGTSGGNLNWSRGFFSRMRENGETEVVFRGAKIGSAKARMLSTKESHITLLKTRALSDLMIMLLNSKHTIIQFWSGINYAITRFQIDLV